MVYRDTSQRLTHFTIVYAGPPTVGKTESIRALSHELRDEQAVYTPREHEGRTLYFDWLEYVGGLFMGDPIRCQIVSVPGQEALGERRQQLLQQADAVIFVADSSNEETLAACKPYYDETRKVLRARTYPPGVVVQCNKQDVPGALSVDAVREALQIDETVNVYGSSAVESDGIRRCFLLAVRLAIERAQALINADETLEENTPYRDGDALLHFLRKREPVWHETAFDIAEILAPAKGKKPATALDLSGSELVDDLADPDPTDPDSADPNAVDPNMANPSLTDSNAAAPDLADPFEASAAEQVAGAGGHVTTVLGNGELAPRSFKRLVWPAVSGRSLLYRLADVELPQYADAADDDWIVETQGWCLFSRDDLEFDDEHQARVALFHIGRGLLTVESLLGSNRCFALSDSASGGVRIWEVIAPVPGYFQPLKTALADARGAELLQLQATLTQLAQQLAMADGLEALAVDSIYLSEQQVRIVRPLLPDLHAELRTQYSAQQWLQDWQQQLSAAGTPALAALVAAG